MDQNDAFQYTIGQLIEAWVQFTKYISQHPEALMKTQLNYWNDHTKLWQELGLQTDLSQIEYTISDRRFTHKDWQENILAHFIMRSYLLLSQHMSLLIKEITKEADPQTAKKIKFYTQQLLDAISPSNFANINPEILAKTLETNGINLLTGMNQLLADLAQGQVNTRTTDVEAFKLGENIACTSGKVIYENDLMQLIQYTATTPIIHQYPLLIIPPWINKYYILDLQPENSLVKWLVDQGITVFIISWVNPTQQHSEKQFSDYMVEGPLTALNIIKQVTGEAKANVLGYCIGGTLLGCMLAYLAKKHDSSVMSATFLTTLFDFSEPGDLGIFIDEDQINMLEKHMEANGYLDGNLMAAIFNILRSKDLVWSSFVDNYLKAQKPKSFDFLYWNSDATNIPKQVHSFYLRNMYLNNYLIQSSKIKLQDIPIDLECIETPSYFLAAQDDHIIPWKSSYKSILFSGPVKFVLTTSGHVAGVVNPPYKNKHGYWLNDKIPQNPENYLASANFIQGSWWNDWIEWLKQYSGGLQSINCLKIGELNPIEDAPGTYVKVRIAKMLIDQN